MASDNGSAEVAELRRVADDAAKLARTVFLTVLLVATYLAVTIGSTTDIQLLKGSTLTLPIVNVGLPIVGFYWFAPWFFVLLHFNLLLQLYLLSRKLRRLDKAIKNPRRISADRERERDKIFSFPFSHMLVRAQGGMMGFLLAAFVWTTTIALPLAILLWMQIRFLPYHDPAVTWTQRAAVLADIALLLLIWPGIMDPEGKWGSWWRRAFLRFVLADLWLLAGRGVTRAFQWLRHGIRRVFETVRKRLKIGGPARALDAPRKRHRRERARGSLSLNGSVLFAFILSLMVATVPGEDLEEGLADILPSTLLIDAKIDPEKLQIPRKKPKENQKVYAKRVEAIKAEAKARIEARLDRCHRKDRKCFFPTFHLFDSSYAWFHRNLRLADQVLLVGSPKPETLAALRPKPQEIDIEISKGREEALLKVTGLILRNRDLRFANMRNVMMVKADLRGANLEGTDLRGAILSRARMQPWPVELGGRCAVKDRDLPKDLLATRTRYEADKPSYVPNQQTDIDIRPRVSNAKLCVTSLRRTRLDGAWLDGARIGLGFMSGAQMGRATLVKAQLRHTWLKSANLRLVRLQGANLREVRLQGSNLPHARLQGANLREARLQGANLRFARLQGANLGSARLQGANLVDAQIQGADLRAAGLLGANLWKAQLQGADLRRAVLHGANLYAAQLQGANLRGAVLNLTDLRWVNRGEFTIKDFDLLAKALGKEVRDVNLRRRILAKLEDRIGKRANLKQASWIGGSLCEFVLKLGIRTACPNKHTSQYYELLVEKVLTRLACQVEGAPAIAKEFARRAHFTSRSKSRLLAAALLRPDCAGGAKLPIETKQILCRWVSLMNRAKLPACAKAATAR